MVPIMMILDAAKPETVWGRVFDPPRPWLGHGKAFTA
jgi:hypothetical protein